MEAFLASCKYVAQLLARKELAAGVAVVWIAIRITKAYLPQFGKVFADCYPYMHILDIGGLLATVVCAAHAVGAAAAILIRHFAKRLREHAVMKEVKQGLQASGSQQQKILVFLYHTPNARIDPQNPYVKRMEELGIIRRTGSRPNFCVPCTRVFFYDLEQPVREYMDTRREEILRLADTIRREYERKIAG